MKIIDDDNKKLYWWNKNYFFVGTVFVVLLNIILYATGGNSWTAAFGTRHNISIGPMRFNNLIVGFLESFTHANWQHVLLNMLCFFIAGTYIERRKGTLPLVLLIIVMAFFTSITVTVYVGNYMHWHGYSGVNFGLYAYIIIDYCFMFKTKSKTKINIIYGAIILALIYFSMCFNGGTTSIGWEWYPYDLMNNIGHYPSFVSGAVLTLTIQIVKLFAKKEETDKAEMENNYMGKAISDD